MYVLDMRTVITGYIVSDFICLMVMASLWLRNRRRFGGLGFWLADFALVSLCAIFSSWGLEKNAYFAA